MLPTSFPTPHILDIDAAPALRWGVVGAGWIADIFVDAVHKHTRQRVTAVASLTPGKGEAFAAAHGIDAVFGDYRQLATSADIDVVYVATPPRMHLEHALLAISAGKHVLVEKPFTTTEADARTLVAAAAAAGVLVMEAMWTRYLPQSDIIRQLLADGVLGDIEVLLADFGQKLTHQERLMSPDDGGALLDLGIYPFAFASGVLGAPTIVRASGSLSPAGVDLTSTVILDYTAGAQATLTSSIEVLTPTRASIGGSEGLLEVHGAFFVPSGLTLYPPEFRAPGMTWVDESEVQGHEGLSYQATALATFVDGGLLESPLRSHAETISDIAVIAEARHQIGAYLTGEAR
ncbi:MAG: Gfo/Idh/MocA family oxidoreductase [Burkholderiaceae bacterium]|nr:Gfo/Idh/MocA family oxidoreductase [Microbacteriaceae bacterium]